MLCCYLSNIYFINNMEINTNVSSLELIIGPMFAGKTTELMRRLNLYNEMNLHVLYINSCYDNRGEIFSTHNETLKNNNNITGVKANTLHDLFGYINDFDVIGIDEGQFFRNLFEDIKYIVNVLNKKVIVSGLDSDYKREPFGDIIKLIPLCDSVIKYKPFCKLCRDDKKIVQAIFTLRHSSGDDLIDIGGKDKYYPVCRQCYNKNNIV